MQEQRLLLACDSSRGDTSAELQASTNQSKYGGVNPRLDCAALSAVRGQISITTAPHHNHHQDLPALRIPSPLFTMSDSGSS